MCLTFGLPLQKDLPGYVEMPLQTNLEEACATAENPATLVQETMEVVTPFVGAMRPKMVWHGISQNNRLEKVVVFGHGGPGVFRSVQELDQDLGAEPSEDMLQAVYEREHTMLWCDPAPEVSIGGMRC